jgi:polyisoprenoid-binding protein YceI
MPCGTVEIGHSADDGGATTAAVTDIDREDGAMKQETYRFGPESGTLLVRTGRSGMGRRAGHDLTIEMTRWSAEAYVDPADPARSTVSVEVEVDSLEPREGTGGLKPFTDADRAEVKRIATEQILHADKYPTISFRSTRVSGTPDAFAIDGELTIKGVTRPLAIRGAVTDEIRADATLAQSTWGITPYSAFFGTLRLADEVAIELTAAF